MSIMPQAQAAAGVGLRLQHIAEVAATRPPAAWLEIHPENFIANPHAAELLDDLARDYPVSVHSVGVSIGSADGVDHRHLKRVKALIDRIDPFLVSGHLAWSTHEGAYLNDLLPLPYDRESLAVLARHVDEVQQALGRPYHVENPSNFLGFAGSTMTETQFLGELVARMQTKLLLRTLRINDKPEQAILKLVAESVRSADLIIAGPPPDASGNRLILQPDVLHHVHGRIRSFNANS